ncbi:ParM/StbA family protein [Bacillus haynesii]|uniref:ParM/StbA family protein n=1 Tax=Bacillus haynesii TaxID=1925021 RepID=UPI0022817E34|nr:ParM/StbA family protein [Bacillus haynesii]MCY8737551.1 ParM/StbA family protein [Bacillus haynesii]MEC0709742.1 ParM/StbA family protein [Bacillus haynesii]MEC0736879.1 ParM/StbA family protein [Bacillus haynesii]
MNMKVAADIGNSTTKMIVDDELFSQPSVIRRLMRKPQVTETDLNKNVVNLDENLTVHITSPAIKETSDGLYVIGQKAITTDLDKVQNMNIKLGNKHKHDLPVIMILSMIARKIVKDEFNETGELASNYEAVCELSSAIPASEFSFEKAELLEKRFEKDGHTVVVYLGEKKVTVQITFKKVKVTQEGVPAIFALLSEDASILEEFNEMYKKEDDVKEDVLEPKDLKKMKIFHVDIGDGTTEFIYTDGVNPILDACSGEKRGVGHATEEATVLLNEQVNGLMKVNRQSFMGVVSDKTHNLHDEAKNALDVAKGSQANFILDDTIEKVANKAGNNIDLLVVYGGGSIQFKKYLFNDLKEFADQIKTKLLWVPEKKAVNLNVIGLDILNRKVFFRKKR